MSQPTVEEVARELRDANAFVISDEACRSAAHWALAFAAKRERAVAEQALELVDELRGYAQDWDWKYGEDWNEQTAALRRLAAEVDDGE